MATVWTNESKIAPVTEQYLFIGDGFKLLIGDSYSLKIQDASDGTVWSNNSKSSSSWTNQSKN